MVKIGQSVITGYTSGVWNKESKSFEVKRGVTKNGKKYQIFEVKVSSKDKESGEYTNGKGIKVMLWGETKIESGQEIGVVGKFQPDNYTTQDGKEVKGNILNAFADDLFKPDSWDKQQDKKPGNNTAADEEMPWDA